MSGRTIWIVRLIGIVVFLVLMYLLASLHSRLVKMNQEAGRQSSITGNFELRIANCGFRISRSELTFPGISSRDAEAQREEARSLDVTPRLGDSA